MNIFLFQSTIGESFSFWLQIAEVRKEDFVVFELSVSNGVGEEATATVELLQEGGEYFSSRGACKAEAIVSDSQEQLKDSFMCCCCNWKGYLCVFLKYFFLLENSMKIYAC